MKIQKYAAVAVVTLAATLSSYAMTLLGDNLYGVVGVESQINKPNDNKWAYFQTISGASGPWPATAGTDIYRSTGGGGLLGDTVQVNFDLGDNTDLLEQANIDNVSLTLVPEPGTFALIGGFFALTAVALRHRC